MLLVFVPLPSRCKDFCTLFPVTLIAPLFDSSVTSCKVEFFPIYSDFL